MPPSVLARFWALIRKPEDPNGCWIWTGYVNQPGKPRGRHGRNLHPRPRFIVSGGRYEHGRRVGQLHVYAHRLTLALATGKKLEEVAELEAHHLCANEDHRCVNPYHQEWRTPEEHRQDHATERIGHFI